MSKSKAMTDLENFVRKAPPGDVLELIDQLIEEQPELASALLKLLRATQKKTG